MYFNSCLINDKNKLECYRTLFESYMINIKSYFRYIFIK